MDDVRKIIGKIYDIQSFSVQDGPGIRLSIFLKGCPLRCLWCHSPESQKFETELNWMEMKCVGTEKCGLCISACPEQAIEQGKKVQPFNMTGEKGEPVTLVKVNPDKCTNCGKCALACPANALYMCGKEYTVDEVMKRVYIDRPFFEKSGGGVTISGGEALSQHEFTLAMLKRLKEEGIHTAVDTTGFAKWEIIEKILPYTDLFLYDLKCMDSDMHKQVTGVPNELILENAIKIAKAGGKLQIRIPTIPTVNDSEEAYDMFGKFILKLGDSVEEVQILPYHKLGIVKWNRLLRNDPILVAEPPTDELINERKNQLEAMGIKVSIH